MSIKNIHDSSLSEYIGFIAERLVDNEYAENDTDLSVVISNYNTTKDVGYVRLLNEKTKRTFSFLITPNTYGDGAMICEDFELPSCDRPTPTLINKFFGSFASISNLHEKILTINDELSNADINLGCCSGYDLQYRYFKQIGPFNIEVHDSETNSILMVDNDFWIRIYEQLDGGILCDVSSIQGIHLAPKIAWDINTFETFIEVCEDPSVVGIFKSPSAPEVRYPNSIIKLMQVA